MDKDKTSTRLASYLQSIRDGKLLNYSTFERELRKQSVPESTMHDCFSAELVKPNKYRVRIVNQNCFDSLYARFGKVSLENRTNAALAGDSHRTKVSGSFLLLRNQQNLQPVAVWFEADTFYCSVKQSRYALLVENLENYIATDQMVAFLKQCGVVVDVSKIDVIYASGNQITNRLHRPFLQSYQTIFCLFDVDLGALKMYQALCNMLSDTEIRFVYPEDIFQRLKGTARQMPANERAELLKYVGHSAELDQLIQHMRETGNKLEQETYLEFSE